ncbi:hypothetical protein KCU88_g8, partial [Aureobasidium melanogenum]
MAEVSFSFSSSVCACPDFGVFLLFFPWPRVRGSSSVFSSVAAVLGLRRKMKSDSIAEITTSFIAGWLINNCISRYDAWDAIFLTGSPSLLMSSRSKFDSCSGRSLRSSYT